MTEVLLIRHGQTLWNESGKYQGHTDVALSPEGQKQAQMLRDKLKTKKITAFFASDLSRAYETAKIIAEPHQKEVTVLPEFRELNFGQWEGLSYDEIMADYGDIATKWYNAPGNVCIPGGESCEQLQERSHRALLNLVQKYPEERIAIISHGGTIRGVISAAMGWSLDCFWSLSQGNTALNILQFYGDKAILKLYNDICHLNL
ncbi:alpha-ribazole phosphatase [Bacillota bacterium LX-D]|nr:alpha-ribazole phosphatase [Bacillota bacterium LX-D]